MRNGHFVATAKEKRLFVIDVEVGVARRCSSRKAQRLCRLGERAHFIGRFLVVDHHPLHTVDHRLRQFSRRHGLFSDLAQGDDRVFIAVTVQRQFGTAGNLARALSRQQHQVKPVGNLVNAIFNGDACHEPTPDNPVSGSSFRKGKALTAPGPKVNFRDGRGAVRLAGGGGTTYTEAMTDHAAETAIAPIDMTIDELREALGRALPFHAAFDGWSDAALASAADELGVPADRARLAFPGGAMDMIQAWIASADTGMIRAARDQQVPDMPVRNRVRTAIWIRFQQAAPCREAVRRAVAILAMPQNSVAAARTLWQTADAIWRATGDKSAGFSHYSKRATVSAVYSATLLVWLNDESEDFADTSAFLDRRINDVIRVDRIKRRWRSRAEHRPSLARFLGRLRYPAI